MSQLLVGMCTIASSTDFSRTSWYSAISCGDRGVCFSMCCFVALCDTQPVDKFATAAALNKYPFA